MYACRFWGYHTVIQQPTSINPWNNNDIYISIHIICTILSSIKKNTRPNNGPFTTPWTQQILTPICWWFGILQLAESVQSDGRGTKGSAFCGILWVLNGGHPPTWISLMHLVCFILPMFIRHSPEASYFGQHQLCISHWSSLQKHTAMLRRRNGRWCFHFSTNRSSSSPITRMNTPGVARQVKILWESRQFFPCFAGKPSQAAVQSCVPQYKPPFAAGGPYVPYIFRCVSHSFPFGSKFIVISEPAMSPDSPGFVLNRPTTRSESYGRLEFNVWYGALTLVICVPLLLCSPVIQCSMFNRFWLNLHELTSTCLYLLIY